ncbi:unnamed protein product [Cunninghamella blakesleeana]
MKRKQNQRIPSFIQFENKRAKVAKAKKKRKPNTPDGIKKKIEPNNPVKIWIVTCTFNNILCLCIYYGNQNERNWVNCYVLNSCNTELEHYYIVGALHILENDDIPKEIIIYSDCKVLYLENAQPIESNSILYNKIQNLVEKRAWSTTFLPFNNDTLESYNAINIAQQALKSKRKQMEQLNEIMPDYLLKANINNQLVSVQVSPPYTKHEKKNSNTNNQKKINTLSSSYIQHKKISIM